MRFAALYVGALLALTACGQKGPLYLPDEGGAIITQPPRPTPDAAPAPPAEPRPGSETKPAEGTPDEPASGGTERDDKGKPQSSVDDRKSTPQ